MNHFDKAKAEGASSTYFPLTVRSNSKVGLDCKVKLTFKTLHRNGSIGEGDISLPVFVREDFDQKTNVFVGNVQLLPLFMLGASFNLSAICNGKPAGTQGE